MCILIHPHFIEIKVNAVPFGTYFIENRRNAVPFGKYFIEIKVNAVPFGTAFAIVLTKLLKHQTNESER